MGKKKLKRLKKKLDKLDSKLYENNKFVSKEEFLESKLSKSVRRYYDKLSEDRKKTFLRYVIKQDEWQELESLKDTGKLEVRDEKLTSKKCKSIGELIKNIKQTRKRKKKRRNNLLKTKKGLLLILNPEAYDQTLLTNDEYRNYLAKLADKEKKKSPNVELDCTIKGFTKELLSNSKVNESVIGSFWNKHGY